MFFKIAKFIWLRLPSWRALFYRSQNDKFLFMPINGAGLGHLTRCLAIAKEIKKQKPNAEIIFLTTSIGVTLVHRAGFSCHHITPAALLNSSAVSWNILFYKTLQNVLSLHRPSTLIFDGTVPYLGLQKAMYVYPSIRYVWIKRGLYKGDVNSERLETFLNKFNCVIAPGELEDEKSFEIKVNHVNPVIHLNKTDLLPRSVARNFLRLSMNDVCAYIQLGAGNINGINDLQEKLISWMQKRGVRVVLGSSPISLTPIKDSIADNVIVDYPNSQYFSAFDFAVLAGGYNSVCEAVALGMPALFIPNTKTGADDQLRRSLQAVSYGRYEVLQDIDEDSFGRALDKILFNNSKKIAYQKSNGSLESANLILGLS